MDLKSVKISIAGVFVVVLSNFIVPSQTNGFTEGLNFSFKSIWDNENADEVFRLRYQNSEFKRRPFVLGFQKLLKNKLAIPYQFSFNLINYCCLFLFFLLVPTLVRKVTGKCMSNNLVQVYFIISFPIIFAFYGSICTYDDIIQYLFLSLFLIFLFSNNQLISALMFLLACITRETSFLYLIVVIAFLAKNKDIISRQSLYWIISSLLYVAFLSWFLDSELLKESRDFLVQNRFYSWEENLFDLATVRESSVIIVLMTGIPLVLLVKKYLNLSPDSINGKYWVKISVCLILINCIVVLITALIREARLLFIPLLIAIPILQLELEESFIFLKGKMKKINWWQDGLILLLSFVFSFFWYSTQTKGTGYIFKLYTFIYTVTLLQLILWVISDRSRKVEKLTTST